MNPETFESQPKQIGTARLGAGGDDVVWSGGVETTCLIEEYVGGALAPAVMPILAVESECDGKTYCGGDFSLS